MIVDLDIIKESWPISSLGKFIEMLKRSWRENDS